MSERFPNDVDPIETRDWLQAIESVIREEGVERAQYLIDQLLSEARKGGVKVAAGTGASNYINTIAVEDEPEYPGNLELERRIRSAIRWNAIMTVLRASKKDLELGGHMASFQSSATVYDVCFNHFFRARNEQDGGYYVSVHGQFLLSSRIDIGFCVPKLGKCTGNIEYMVADALVIRKDFRI